MPSIYKQLKNSDRKFIRMEKSRIRREFLGFKKQEEMISELYKKLLGQPTKVKLPIDANRETPVSSPVGRDITGQVKKDIEKPKEKNKIKKIKPKK